MMKLSECSEALRTRPEFRPCNDFAARGLQDTAAFVNKGVVRSRSSSS